MSVLRYEIGIDECGDYSMVISKKGSHVKYTDYQKLLRRCKDADEALNEMQCKRGQNIVKAKFCDWQDCDCITRRYFLKYRVQSMKEDENGGK